MPRTIHIIGAGLAGLVGRGRLTGRGETVVVHEATSYAGGRCRSYHDAALGMTIDNGNHLLLSGNHAALGYLRTLGARASAGRSADARNFRSSISRAARVDAALQRRPLAVVDFRCAARACRARTRSTICRSARLLWAEHDKSGRRGDPLQRDRLRAAGAAAAARGAQHRPGGGLGRLAGAVIRETHRGGRTAPAGR